MDMMDKFTISASMLLTGFSIVFAVLIFLIFIIWLYGFIISKAQSKAIVKKTEKKKVKVNKDPEKTETPAENKKHIFKAEKDDDELSEEVVAVISAAVYSMYGSTKKVRIKSIKKSRSRSAWSNAGILNNTRPFSF